MSINTEDLVNAYLQIRNQREAILREYEAADKELENEMTKLEAAMLEVCNSVNADSIKTSYGTVMRRLKEKYFCTDWDNFYKFVLDHDAVQLLEKRIHQGNFKQFLDDNEGDGLPPGVNVMREYGVSVRKAS
jgi:hypothetical protein